MDVLLNLWLWLCVCVRVCVCVCVCVFVCLFVCFCLFVRFFFFSGTFGLTTAASRVKIWSVNALLPPVALTAVCSK